MVTLIFAKLLFAPEVRSTKEDWSTAKCVTVYRTEPEWGPPAEILTKPVAAPSFRAHPFSLGAVSELASLVSLLSNPSGSVSL